MERPPHYDFRDVLWAPARAFSAKKILVMTWFLCLALVCYDVFTYAAAGIEGENLRQVYSVWGFFPFYVASYDSAVAATVFGIGIAAAVLLIMLGFFGVAAINIEELRGNRFFSAVGAIRFALGRFTQIFLSEFAIVLFVGFVVLLFVLFGVITRIPYLGEWLYGLFFVVPAFIIAICTVFIIFVFNVSVVLLPATAAAERNGECFTAILETFSTVIRRPLHWAGYTAYAVIAGKVCAFVYAYFCYRAVQFTAVAAGFGGGSRLTDLIRSGLSHLPANSDFVRTAFNIFPGIDWSFSISQWTRGGSDDAAGYLMAVMLFLIFASIIGYLLATVATAQARGYVAIRYRKDGYSIPDESPMFFTDEPVNPPLDDRAEDSGT